MDEDCLSESKVIQSNLELSNDHTTRSSKFIASDSVHSVVIGSSIKHQALDVGYGILDIGYWIFWI